ncbi:roquin-2-like [Frankliniella occidentalis]|uniref:Roquin-2-like n=1 Tax=Frankliniella occidentalis TaxID=133901 RepID=A0A9C6XDS2_FRAOC|nr:roquin-2-like [Frankliniella occidentalis]
MSRRSIDVELLCDICSQNFDLTLCRPKVLPCGHTICKRCLHNPALEKKCPTCRKDLTVGPEDHPDNVFIIRMIESDASPPCKVPRKENAKLQQLQRGLDLGRNLVQQLQQMVPMAVAALNRQMESWAAQVRQLEEAVEREAAGGEEANSQELTTEQLELMAKLEDSVRLLTNDKCSVVAEGGECTWRASVQPGQFDNILHLLLLQLRADGPLEKVRISKACHDGCWCFQ